MIFMQTFEGRNRRSKPLLYGGKGSVWVNPKIGEFYYIIYNIEYPDMDDHKIGKVIGFDMNNRLIKFNGIDKDDKIMHEFSIMFNNNARLSRLATKEEIALYNKIETMKRFDL